MICPECNNYELVSDMYDPEVFKCNKCKKIFSQNYVIGYWLGYWEGQRRLIEAVEFKFSKQKNKFYPSTVKCVNCNNYYINNINGCPYCKINENGDIFEDTPFSGLEDYEFENYKMGCSNCGKMFMGSGNENEFFICPHCQKIQSTGEKK